MKIRGFMKRMEVAFVAVTFAEAGLPSVAREILRPRSFTTARREANLSRFLKEVGLAGVKVRYCMVKV